MYVHTVPYGIPGPRKITALNNVHLKLNLYTIVSPQLESVFNEEEIHYSLLISKFDVNFYSQKKEKKKKQCTVSRRRCQDNRSPEWICREF